MVTHGIMCMRGLLQMAWINVLNYTHSGAKLLNGYSYFNNNVHNQVWGWVLKSSPGMFNYNKYTYNSFLQCLQTTVLLSIAKCTYNSHLLRIKTGPGCLYGREWSSQLSIPGGDLRTHPGKELAVTTNCKYTVLWHKMLKDYGWNVIRKMPKHNII